MREQGVYVFPPIAPKQPHVHTEHGVERDDPYHWLRERENPAVLDYLNAENAHTDAHLAPLEPLKDRLYDEMLSRIQEADVSAAIPRGPWEYYHRTVEGKAYALHCRRPRGGGEEHVLLDENALAAEHDFFHLGDFAVSADHTRMAYTVDTDGSETYTLTIAAIDGSVLDTLEATSHQVVWGPSGTVVYWTELDDTHRPWRVRRHSIGSDSSTVLFEDSDPRFYVWVSGTRLGRHLVIGAGHSESSEVWLVDGDEADPVCVRPRSPGLVYEVEVAHDLWIISNDGDDPATRTPDNRLYRTRLDGDLSDWKLVRDVTPGRAIEGLELFERHRVLQFRENGRVHLEVEHADGRRHDVVFPDPVYVARLTTTFEHDSDVVFYSYSSPIRPAAVVAHHLDDGTDTVVKTQPTPGYDPSAYGCSIHHATAKDGVSIPYTLIWRGESAPTKAPCLLYGYGSYGITVEPVFRSSWVNLLDRGFAVVIAHPRGGGFLGRAWYEAAKFENKARTFDDFIAVGESLVRTQVTQSDRLAIMGGSAGGLLMGAVMNRAPDLAAAVVAQVPFVDVVSTMLDATLPLTAGEWEEWGDPREASMFHAMLAYSPYDHAGASAVPDLFVTSGLNDPRVQYWEPTKWVARLRDRAPESHILLKTHMGAGHQGSSGRYGRIDDQAEVQAWILSRIAPHLIRRNREVTSKP